MEKEKKVLVVTDWFGNLHINPLGNAAYYQAANERNKKTPYQYKVITMGEAEAEKFVNDNKGSDPKWVKPGDAVASVHEKDARIKELEEQLAELKGKSGGTADGKVPAKELIEKINAATTAEEIDELVSKDEERTTVIDAAKAKRKELKDAAK